MKKKNDASKKLSKWARKILFETVGDYLYSGANDARVVLIKNNMECYMSNDDDTFNYLVYIDDVMRKAKIDKILQLKIDSIITSIFELGKTTNKAPLYETLNKISDEFIKTYSVAEYFCLARKLISATPYGFLLNPLFLMFDYLYAPEQVIYGEENQKPIKRDFTATLNNTPLPLIICLSSSWDNMALDKPSSREILKVVEKYVFTGYPGLVNIFKYYHQDTIEKYMCGVASFYRQNSILNKFMFNNYTPPLMYQVEEYALIEKDLEHQFDDVRILFSNILFEIDKNILMHRKYIYHDTSIDNFTLGTGDVKEKDTILMDNFNIREKHIEYYGEEYYITYFTYKIKNYTRTIPYPINNFYALNGGLGCLDLNNLFFLLSLYDVLDECEKNFENIEQFKKFITPFKKLGDEIHNDIEITMSNKTSGQREHYKQYKEVKVEAFIRSLPAGQKASSSAIELAKKYNVSLGEGKTIVSSYIRNKNKTKV